MDDFKQAAIVVWMPTGEQPSIKSFQVEDGQMPDTEGYWEAGAALIVAAKGPTKSGKEAWVKVGGHVLSPDECTRAYERFKNGGSLHA